MGRAPCCDKANVKKGPWSPEEDAKLKEYIEKHGTGGNWIALPQKAGLRRCGKSCRLRWLNYLRPNIKHGEFSDYEDRIIYSLYANIGSRWSIIAAQLPGRTDNDIKNYWNTKLKKKLMQGMMMMQSQSTHHKRPHLISNHPLSSLSNNINNNNIININNNINNTTHLLQNSSIPSPYQEIPSLYNESCLDAYYTTIPSRTFDHISQNYPSLIPPNSTNALIQNQDSSPPLFPIQENDKKNILIFGGDQASCSSSDNGSCITNQINLGKDDHGLSSSGEDLGYFNNGVDENQKFLISTNHDGYPVAEDKTADYTSIEEIKQLISTDNICNNLNNFFSEIKAEDRVLYY